MYTKILAQGAKFGSVATGLWTTLAVHHRQVHRSFD